MTPAALPRFSARLDGVSRQERSALRRLLLLGPLDQRRRHDERTPARDDEPVACELVERARDRLAAAADHVRELLLRRPAANDEAVGARRAFLAREADQAMDQAPLDVAQRPLRR